MGKKDVLRNKKATTAVANEGVAKTATKKSYTKEELEPIKDRILREKEDNDEAISFELQMSKFDKEHHQEDERSQDSGFGRISSGQGTVPISETLKRLQTKRLLIEAALKRMSGGTYGIDADTGQLIPLDRLKASPYTTKATKPGMEVRNKPVGQSVSAQAEAMAG